MDTKLFVRQQSGGMFGVIDRSDFPTGNIWWVDSGGTYASDAAGYGHNPDAAFATIAYAEAAASAEDTIFVLPGHSESLLTTLTVNLAGLSIIGLGEGALRPQITVTGAVDGINIAAANITIENLYFNEATAAATANINIAGANARVRNCHFDLATNDAECITVPDAGDNAIIQGNEFVITGNGPSTAIEIESANVTGLEICNNVFNGGSGTNQWDTAAINSTVAHTHCRIHDNEFLYGTAVIVATSVSTALWNNKYGVGCRASANSPMTIYAADGASTVSQGTLDDPTTIVDAVTRCTAAGDTVLLLPGTYTITTALLADVAGMTIKAANGLGTVEIANDTDDAESVAVTAVGVVIRDLVFTKGAANTTDGKCFLNVDASRCQIHNCVFDLEARANADAINFATATKDHMVKDCMFTSGGSAKSYIADASSSSRIIDNFFDCSATDCLCYEQLGSPGDGVLIADNRFVSDGADGALMSWQGSPGKQHVVGNYITGGNGDTDILGDDGDLDQYVIGNYQHAANGAVVIIDPSVT